jgi:hypothetical protein
MSFDALKTGVNSDRGAYGSVSTKLVMPVAF